MPDDKKPDEVKAMEEPGSGDVEVSVIPEEEEVEIVEPEEGKTDDVEIVEEEAEVEEKVYKAKAKPDLSPDEKRALAIRAAKRKKKPKFRRQEWFRYVRVKESWRRPRGIQSKLRRNYKYRPPKVSKGYRVPKMARGRHPSGFEDILVHSPKDLDGLDPKKQAARVGHTVGYLKRVYIQLKADELGIRIVNIDQSTQQSIRKDDKYKEEAKRLGLKLSRGA